MAEARGTGPSRGGACVREPSFYDREVTAAARSFWAGLGEARRDELAAWPEWEPRLEAALDEGQAAVGARLPREALAEEIAARFDGDDEEARRWWAHLHAGDLALACACARGDGQALAAFEGRFCDE